MIQHFRPLWSLPLPSVCLPFINMYKCVFLHTNSVPSSILIKCLVTAFLHINLLKLSRYRVFSHDVTAAILMKTMKTMKRRPCWCPKPILRELNSFLMQTLSFVPINLHRYWPRGWKHLIGIGKSLTLTYLPAYVFGIVLLMSVSVLKYAQ